jgi:hypothetical protein
MSRPNAGVLHSKSHAGSVDENACNPERMTSGMDAIRIGDLTRTSTGEIPHIGLLLDESADLAAFISQNRVAAGEHIDSLQ